MSPWLIATACALGAFFIAFFNATLRLRWPLAALALLLAAIATQLYLAARGESGFHDLAAVRAQMFTVAPALAGLGGGLALAFLGKRVTPRRDIPAAITLMALLVAVVALIATMLI